MRFLSGIKNNLNLRFLLLQGAISSLCCVAAGFLSPTLLLFGYGEFEIGTSMTLAALGAAVIKPFWGHLHDKYSCSKQILISATAVGSLFYILLIQSNGTHGVVEIAVMGIFMTIMSMLNFVDSWAMRLISDGHPLNYSASRSGGSFFYAITAILFGNFMSQHGIKPGIGILLALFFIETVIALSIPNPVKHPDTIKKPKKSGGIQYLLHNKPFLLLLAAYFIGSMSMCATDSFFPVLISDLGGTEKQVGIGLFIQAMSEIPTMVFFTRIKKRSGRSSTFFLILSLGFFGVKCLTMGLAPTYQIAIAVTLLNGLSYALFLSASVDYVMEHVHQDYLATAFLLSSAFGSSMGSVIGNFMNGLIADQFGVSRMMVISSSFAFLAALIILFTEKNKRTAKSNPLT